MNIEEYLENEIEYIKEKIDSDEYKENPKNFLKLEDILIYLKLSLNELEELDI